MNNYQNLNSSDSLIHEIKNTGIGASIGIEFRKNINNEFQLKVGVDGIYRYSKRETDDEDKRYDFPYTRYLKNFTHNFGLGLVFGANYVYKERLVLGVEIVPSYIISRGEETSISTQQDEKRETIQKIEGSSFRLSNGATLSIAYRF